MKKIHRFLQAFTGATVTMSQGPQQGMGQKLVPGIVTRIPAPVSFNGDFNGDLMGFKWCFYGYLMWFNGIFMVIFNAMVVFNGDFMVIVWEYYGNIVGI